jgi:hypothetical protein
MFRCAIVFPLFVYLAPAFTQTTPQTVISDALAISLAQKSVAAITGGTPVNDVRLNANVTSVLGPNNETA